MANEKGVEDIRFDIENLLGAENLMNPDSVKTLQHLLNRYVMGSPFLQLDGQLGHRTDSAIQQYRNESRYWGGHSKMKIDPIATSRKYDEHIEGTEGEHFDAYYGTGR
jgi:lysozyme family protein